MTILFWLDNIRFLGYLLKKRCSMSQKKVILETTVPTSLFNLKVLIMHETTTYPLQKIIFCTLNSCLLSGGWKSVNFVSIMFIIDITFMLKIFFVCISFNENVFLPALKIHMPSSCKSHIAEWCEIEKIGATTPERSVNGGLIGFGMRYDKDIQRNFGKYLRRW